ncbi:hypothetical protein GALMADRAFT_882553 [Galerina marginata CBS 339.88]|uniref:Uncharacterized protein n=1 Tax=Galerina marginata (strain CBS 339.88) TaxID=685588 RepID=A0A067SL35_GALM3|nr:hypothetical protein GALMADRAFT_882553 [Galerina marginata CBS 339.88]
MSQNRSFHAVCIIYIDSMYVPRDKGDLIQTDSDHTRRPRSKRHPTNTSNIASSKCSQGFEISHSSRFAPGCRARESQSSWRENNCEWSKSKREFKPARAQQLSPSSKSCRDRRFIYRCGCRGLLSIQHL